MQRTSLNSGSRNCRETTLSASVDAFPGHIRSGCSHKAKGVELGPEPPPPPPQSSRSWGAAWGGMLCCRWSADCVESWRPAACPWLAAAAGGRARVNARGAEPVFPMCSSRLRKGGRSGVAAGWAGARNTRAACRGRAAGSGLRTPGSGLRAPGGRRWPAGWRMGGWGAGEVRPVGLGRGRCGARGGGVAGRGRAARGCGGRPPARARRSMAAAARPAPRGPARWLQCGPESNRLSRRDVSAPPSRPLIPPPPRAGLPSLPPPPAAPGSRTLRPRSFVIVTSQRDGPGWNLLLLRDVKSRAGGSSAAGLRGRRERRGGGGCRVGGGSGGGGGCDRPRPSAAKRRASLQVSAESLWAPCERPRPS